MAKHIQGSIVAGSEARFESPLALWIAIWQRQLALGQHPRLRHAGNVRARVLPDRTFARTINADEPSPP